ncbi:MAG: alpha-amylase family glycosyl hydrolase [Anaerolineaceae bacterium]
MEFHISRQARDRYDFDKSLFSFSGNIIFTNFHNVRLFAQKVNQKRDLIKHPEKAVKAGHLNAMGLIDEILHLVISLYRRQMDKSVFENAAGEIEKKIGLPAVHKTLLAFCEEFPPLDVYNGKISAADYLSGTTEGISNQAIVLEEMTLLWLANQNQAFAPFLEFFDDAGLTRKTKYDLLMDELKVWFKNQPPFGPESEDLIGMLRSPAIASPDSLSGQIEFIRTKWGYLLGDYLLALLRSLDSIKEEEKLSFFGPGPVAIPTYSGKGYGAEDSVRFSHDLEWMPSVVIMAKNTLVWLDQLSKAYNREITRLDQIPDEELDRLAEWGFTGLWLIGLWERSKASARIKQICGNPEAVASAYSIADYRIADNLGGDSAYRQLSERAWQRGIRLASDMVPNHMSIDSDWVMEHPERFISLDYSPFPAYAFNGTDFSSRGDVGVFVEDHYFDRTDAAVVFQRRDHHSGNVRYIYHGNDGTSMPWNDTAQLNYLNPEVREAVIQTILHVARQFPIIRFDAAMTLAKRHYQRLWFPEPGSGGDIPTRSDYGLTKEQFDAAMPVEFWREVVDRVAAEAPNTLLLAEAFWLMEGYFVRTLGMHRVYNSAFMNLLRNEENGKYRTVMKNTLEFDPGILKRYVNFMNNPDERTAVDQFGKGDKYIGICTMMVTMPGLPMFGHGQVEGFGEKYGMEYNKAYLDEIPDQDLIARHRHEIFPLLHRRRLFSGVENFLLYDFFTAAGGVDEDVFAYSNRLGDERALVVYNNRYGNVSGWIRFSVGYLPADNVSHGGIRQSSLTEGLHLHASDNMFVTFVDCNTGLEYIRSSREIADKGLFLDLHAYQTHVFLDIREIQDDANGSYTRLNAYLNGRGVPSLNEALTELFLEPIQNPFREAAHPGFFQYTLDYFRGSDADVLPAAVLEQMDQKITGVLQGLKVFAGASQNASEIRKEIQKRLSTFLSVNHFPKNNPLPGSKIFTGTIEAAGAGFLEHPERQAIILGWLITHNLGKAAGKQDYALKGLSWFDEMHLSKTLWKTYNALGYDNNACEWMLETIRMLFCAQTWSDQAGKYSLDELIKNWLDCPEIQHFLGVNLYEDELWFNHERFEMFLWWLDILIMVDAGSQLSKTKTEWAEKISISLKVIKKLRGVESKSGYKISKLLALAKKTRTL